MIPAGLFDTPDCYFFAFDGDDALFLRMDRDSYRRSIFLDGRIASVDGIVSSIPVAELLERLREEPPPKRPIGWIFHVAHCGSTLLARALDLPERNLVLREPRPLRQLGIERAALGDNESWRERLALAVALATRNYRAGGPVIVKANVPVNFMLDAVLPSDAAAPAILLYYPLRGYLQAILRSPGHRTWVVNVTTQLGPMLGGEVGNLGVPERAALLWVAQMRVFADTLARCPQARSLHAEALFEAPRATVEAAAAHLGMPLGDAELDAIEAGGAFSAYSKDPGIAFDNAARLRQRAALKAALDPEIDRARRWLETRFVPIDLRSVLDRPLLGVNPKPLDG